MTKIQEALEMLVDIGNGKKVDKKRAHELFNYPSEFCVWWKDKNTAVFIKIEGEPRCTIQGYFEPTDCSITDVIGGPDLHYKFKKAIQPFYAEMEELCSNDELDESECFEEVIIALLQEQNSLIKKMIRNQEEL